MRFRLLSILLGAALTFATPAVHATSLVAVNLADLVAHSEKAFAGRVVATDVVETEFGWGDYVAVEVTEDLLGNAAPATTVSWVQARLAKEVPFPGMPRFAVGETRLVFLAGHGRGTCFQAPYALGQGAFILQQDKETGKTLVRNEFGNADLTATLNTDALAKRMAELDPATKSKSASEKQQKAEATALELRTAPGAMDLELVKKAVTATKSFADPAKDLRLEGTAPVKKLEAHAE